MASSERTAASTPPEPFLLGILHLLLAPFPSPLPPSLLSHSARQAVHYLAIRPDDEAYWTCGRTDEQVALRRRQLIEAGNLDDLVLSLPRFAFDLDETKCLITLSLPDSYAHQSLGVVLVWEDNTSPLAAATGGAGSANDAARGPTEDDVRPGWTFLELQALDEAPEQLSTVGRSSERRRPSWYPSLGEAVEAATSSFASTLAPVQASPDPASAAKDEGDASGKTHEREEERNRLRAAMGMDDGEGTTPGAIGSAEDFWAGWSDDEKDTVAAGNPGVPEEIEDDDTGYWDQYSAVGTQVGGENADEDRETIATPPAQSLAAEPEPATRVPRSSTITPATAGTAGHVPPAPAADAQRPTPASPSQQQQQRYFSNTLPPLSPSHHGISPTQPGPDHARFSAQGGSQLSGDASRSPVLASSPRARSQTASAAMPRAVPVSPNRQLSAAAGPPLTPTRQTFSPSRSAASPSRPPYVHQAVSSPQFSPSKHQPSPKRGDLRQASDTLKALPSFPAFPVVARPKGHANSAPSTPSTVPDAAPASGGYFAARMEAPSSTTAPGGAPGKKALPVAPAFTVLPPATFAPQYSNLIPVGPGAARPPRPGFAHGRGTPTASAPVSPGAPSRALHPAPLFSHTSPARPAVQKRPNTATGPSSSALAPPPEVARHGSLTSPLPSTATFPSAAPSSPSLSGGAPNPAPPRPLFAPPATPPHARAAPYESEQVRLDRLASVGSIAGLSIASTSGFTGLLDAHGGVAAHFPLPPVRDVPALEQEDAHTRAEESLRFAMAGLWGLFVAGATLGEREERRRAWERVAGEVARS